MSKKIIIIIFIAIICNTRLISQIKYQATITVKGNYENERTLIIEVSNQTENIYSIHKILEPHYSIPEAIALNNGNLLLIHSLEGTLQIFDKSGQIILEKDFYSLPPYNEQTIKYSIYNSGIILLVTEQHTNILYLIENSGVINSSLELEQGLISGIVSSENGRLFAYSIMQWVGNELINKSLFVNPENNFSAEYPFKFEYGMFNNESDLFLGRTNKSSFYINFRKGDILWQNKLSNDQIYLDGSIEKDKAILVQTDVPKFINNKWTYQKIKIMQKDLTGNELLIQEINKPITKAKLVKNENKISIILDNIESQLKIE